MGVLYEARHKFLRQEVPALAATAPAPPPPELACWCGGMVNCWCGCYCCCQSCCCCCRQVVAAAAASVAAAVMVMVPSYRPMDPGWMKELQARYVKQAVGDPAVGPEQWETRRWGPKRWEPRTVCESLAKPKPRLHDRGPGGPSWLTSAYRGPLALSSPKRCP